MPKPITLSQAEFMLEVQKLPEYKDYAGIVGSAAAQAWAMGAFEYECLRKDAAGFYQPKLDLKAEGLKFQPGSVIKFQKEDDRKGFFSSAKNSRSPSTFLIHEAHNIKGRQRYLDELAGKAQAGKLSTNLNQHVLAESTYGYVTPPVGTWSNMNVQQKVRAWPPPQPGSAASPDAAAIARAKARTWVSKFSPESGKLLDTYVKTSGGWPLGYDATVLVDMWKTLVPDAPLFRQVTAGLLYPSSVGGFFLLKKVMEGFKDRAVPMRGRPAWENWALYLFGAIMTVQGFTDGNKRVARLAYAVTIASGAVDFRAMTDAHGESLGPMK